MKPQVEVVKLEIHHMLAASPPGWNNEVGAPEFLEIQQLLFEQQAAV